MSGYLTSLIPDNLKENSVTNTLSRLSITSNAGAAIVPVLTPAASAFVGVAASTGLSAQRRFQHGKNDLRDASALLAQGELGAFAKRSKGYREAFRTGTNTMKGVLSAEPETFARRKMQNKPFKAPVKRPSLKGGQPHFKVLRVDDVIPGPHGSRLINDYQPRRILRPPGQRQVAMLSRTGQLKDAGIPTRIGGKMASASEAAFEGVESRLNKIGSRVKPVSSPLGNIKEGIKVGAKDLTKVRLQPGPRTTKLVNKLPKGRVRSFGSGLAKGATGTGSGIVNLGKGTSAVATGATRGLTQLGRNVGAGALQGAVGTGLGNAVLVGAAELGAFDALGVDRDDARRHVKDFVTMGDTNVPNLDPVSSVLKTSDAIGNLHDVNVDRGYHDDTVLGTSGFVYDQFAQAGDDVDVEFGDGLIASAGEGIVEGGAALGGRVVGGVGAGATAVVGGTKKAASYLNPWNW